MKLNGILGGGRGKLGASVFTANAGNTIVRQHKSHIRNPKTERQINSRNRLAVASRLSREYSNLIEAGGLSIQYASKRNAFIQIALKKESNIINLENGQLVVDYTKLQFSKNIMHPLDLRFAAISPNRETFTLLFQHDYKPFDSGFVPEEEGQVGFVVALVTDNDRNVIVFYVAENVTRLITIDVRKYANLHFAKGYVFAKWIPKSKNDIITAHTPWRFPSETSCTSYFGVVYSRGPINIENHEK